MQDQKWIHEDRFLQFPEEFDWDRMDSHKLSAVGRELARQCKNDLKAGFRERIPGFRQAMILLIMEA